MTAPSPLFRPLLIGAVAIAMLSQSGCAWTRSKLGMDANDPPEGVTDVEPRRGI